jgi:hypothetical protein
MGKIDDCEMVMLIFFSALGIVCLCVMGWLFYCSMTTPRPRFINPPRPPKKGETKKPEAYSFLQLCSYKQLKVLEELFPPDQKMPTDVGDLGDFLVAVIRQLDNVECHIRNFNAE